jgi:hypothetical protein
MPLLLQDIPDAGGRVYRSLTMIVKDNAAGAQHRRALAHDDLPLQSIARIGSGNGGQNGSEGRTQAA